MEPLQKAIIDLQFACAHLHLVLSRTRTAFTRLCLLQQAQLPWPPVRELLHQSFLTLTLSTFPAPVQVLAQAVTAASLAPGPAASSSAAGAVQGAFLRWLDREQIMALPRRPPFVPLPVLPSFVANKRAYRPPASTPSTSSSLQNPAPSTSLPTPADSARASPSPSLPHPPHARTSKFPFGRTSPPLVHSFTPLLHPFTLPRSLIAPEVPAQATSASSLLLARPPNAQKPRGGRGRGRGRRRIRR